MHRDSVCKVSVRDDIFGLQIQKMHANILDSVCRDLKCCDRQAAETL